MCCGRSRPIGLASPARAAAPARAAPRPPVAPCGAAGPPPAALFEYRGATALTLVSPITGRVYRFAAPGARLAVAVADQPWVSFVPQVARVG